MRSTHTEPFKRRLAAALVLLALSMSMACRGGEGGGGEQDEGIDKDCVSNKEFFSKEVWKPVLEQRCFSCHNTSGQAKASNFVLQPTSQTGYLDKNLEALSEVSRYEVDGTSILLKKPIGELGHKGGAVLEAGSEELKAIEAMLARFEEPVVCEDTATYEKQFAEVELMSPEATLRKTTLNLGGRLPTSGEYALVEEQGLEGIDQVVDTILTEEMFYVRLKEMFNDMFLTDRYLRNDDAVNLLDGDVYPEARWYVDREEKDFSGEDPEELEAARKHANDSVAREPLELIAHIVREERPFTEILTADYMMVNPFSARVYGVDGVDFKDKLDPNEWREGRLPYPHAGIMTSAMFLNRFPTTATNRNRHRSRMIYQFFLATDVMALAERPLDPTSIEAFNPTMNNAQCTSCHAVIDPLAGAFQNWDDRGSYAPREEGWYEEMAPPGFGEAAIEFERYNESLPWLAERIAADPRFATATVHNVYRGLLGHDLVRAQGDDAAVYNSLSTAHDVQVEYFERLSEDFISNNYNLKHLIKQLVKGPYFRIKNIPEELDETERLEYSQMGVGRLLTPEMLDRKIEAVTGLPWAETYDLNRRALIRTDRYRIFYGGIDSDGVTERITDPNGIMANVQWRMANEMACRTVSHDFIPEERQARRYFKFVERTFTPEDENGFPVDAAILAIKQNIQHLHWHVLGERLELDDPEIERTYNLFYDTWKEGSLKVQQDELSDRLACRATRDPLTEEDYPEGRRVEVDRDYTVRAWQAVVTYLLADYNFLYE